MNNSEYVSARATFSPTMTQNLSFRFESRNEGQEAINAAAYEAQNRSNLNYLNFTFEKRNTTWNLIIDPLLFETIPAIIRPQ